MFLVIISGLIYRFHIFGHYVRVNASCFHIVGHHLWVQKGLVQGWPSKCFWSLSMGLVLAAFIFWPLSLGLSTTVFIFLVIISGINLPFTYFGSFWVRKGPVQCLRISYFGRYLWVYCLLLVVISGFNLMLTALIFLVIISGFYWLPFQYFFLSFTSYSLIAILIILVILGSKRASAMLTVFTLSVVI